MARHARAGTRTCRSGSSPCSRSACSRAARACSRHPRRRWICARPTRAIAVRLVPIWPASANARSQRLTASSQRPSRSNPSASLTSATARGNGRTELFGGGARGRRDLDRLGESGVGQQVVAPVDVDPGQLDQISGLGGIGGRPCVLLLDRGRVAAQAHRQGHGDVGGSAHLRIAGDRGPRAGRASVGQRLVGISEQPVRRGHTGQQPGMVDGVGFGHVGAAVDLESASRFALLLVDLAEPPRDRGLDRRVDSAVTDLPIGRNSRAEVALRTVGITEHEAERMVASRLGHLA